MTLRSNCLTLKESRFKFQVIHVLFTSILWDALKKEDLILSIRNNIESKYNLQLEKKPQTEQQMLELMGTAYLCRDSRFQCRRVLALFSYIIKERRKTRVK